VTALIGLAIFLHYFKQLLQGLRFDSVKHVLAISYSQTPCDSINGVAFGHPRRMRCQLHHSVHVLLQRLLIPLDTHDDEVIGIELFDLHAFETGQQLVAKLKP
jgi:hypothetical protein